MPTPFPAARGGEARFNARARQTTYRQMLKRKTEMKKRYQGKCHSPFNPDGPVLAKQWIKRAANTYPLPQAILRHRRFQNPALLPCPAPGLQPEQSSLGTASRGQEQPAQSAHPTAKRKPELANAFLQGLQKGSQTRPSDWRLFKGCSGGRKLAWENEAPFGLEPDPHTGIISGRTKSWTYNILLGSP